MKEEYKSSLIALLFLIIIVGLALLITKVVISLGENEASIEYVKNNSSVFIGGISAIFIIIFYILIYGFKRIKKIILFLIFPFISLASFSLYLSNKIPIDVEPKGNETTVAFISIVTAVLSLSVTVLTLILTIIEIRAKGQIKE